MRAVDFSNPASAATHEAPGDDGAHAAAQFGDSLRSAAQRSAHALPEASREKPGANTSSQTPYAASEGEAPSATPHADAMSPRGQAASRTPSSRDEPAQVRADRGDLRDARPRAHASGHDRASQRDARRHADSPRPPDGVALQTLLAAANPLLASAGDTASAPMPAALTPHDVAASVTQTWLREPSSQDASGVEHGAQWIFTLGDPLTPLAALRVSGDAAAGWGLQLTAGNGLPARDLAAYTERLRRRLRARGQAVDHLEVDDDPSR